MHHKLLATMGNKPNRLFLDHICEFLGIYIANYPHIKLWNQWKFSENYTNNQNQIETISIQCVFYVRVVRFLQQKFRHAKFEYDVTKKCCSHSAPIDYLSEFFFHEILIVLH